MGAISQPANQSESGPGHSLPTNAQPDIRCCPNSRHAFASQRLVAMCQEATYAAQQIALFDHLVGKDEQLWRNIHTKRFRSLEIDDKFPLGRL